MDKLWKRRKRIDLKPLQRITILAAINDDFLKSITPLLNDLSPLPNAVYLLTVIRWIVDYGNKYGRAPREYLDKIFEKYRDEVGNDEAEVRLLATFLSKLNQNYLNNDYEDVDIKFELEKAEKLLQSYAMAKNANDIIEALNVQEVPAAIEIRKSFNLPSLKMITRPPIEIIDSKTINSDNFLTKKIGQPKVVLSPWLMDGSITMIFSPRGIGKTWLCLIIAICITRIRNSELRIGTWRVEENAGVLYIDGEMSEFYLQKRMKGLIGTSLGGENRYNPLTVLSTASVASQYRQQISITDEQWRETIYDYLAKNDQYQLLILDNLSSLAGGLDENDKKQWDPINEWMLSLRHLGVAIIFVHHAGKGGQQRGTSGREDNVDNIIKLKSGWIDGDYDPSAICIEVRFTKARNIESSEIRPFGLKIFENRRNRGWTWESYKIEKKED
jgi:putative DNA primase/helicase